MASFGCEAFANCTRKYINNGAPMLTYTFPSLLAFYLTTFVLFIYKMNVIFSVVYFHVRFAPVFELVHYYLLRRTEFLEQMCLTVQAV